MLAIGTCHKHGGSFIRRSCLFGVRERFMTMTFMTLNHTIFYLDGFVQEFFLFLDKIMNVRELFMGKHKLSFLEYVPNIRNAIM